MLSQIKSHLPGHPWAEKIIYFDTIDSTNTYAKRLAMEGAAEGTVVIAGSQTGGRGRMGRSFSSPAGMGVYFTVILRPDCPPSELMHLTCAAGVAAGDAVAAVSGTLPGIKWTNDLVMSRKKLGGILTEISIDPATGSVAWAVVGIGINCCQEAKDFPTEIREIACSLRLHPSARPVLCAALVQAMYIIRHALFEDKAAILEEFRDRCITIGQEISIVRGEDIRHGKAIGVDDDGALRVAFADGHTEAVASGEVSIRGMYGYL